MNATQLEASISDMRLQVDSLQRRLPDLDEAIEGARTLLGEAEDRLRAQEGEVSRARQAAGGGPTFGRSDQAQTVRWTDGRGTIQLDGPSAADSPTGKAERARQVYDALEAEVTPIRGALSSLQADRASVARSAGLLGGEIQEEERQLARLAAAEAERAQLVGRLGWQQRLSAILRRLQGTEAA